VQILAQMKEKKITQDINTLLDIFGIEVLDKYIALDNWLDASIQLSQEKANLLEDRRLNFIKQGSEWNEEEIKLKFLSFLFFIADVEVDKRLQTFFERPLSTEIDNIALSVISDCMIATPKGKGVPKSPYFFLQEFKKQKGDKHDPEGQMFAAMLIAQHLNQDRKPIYGAWLVGNQWCFTLLHEKSYAYSRYFDATDKEELLSIVAIIHHLKILILQR
jgi:hypothetical protein